MQMNKLLIYAFLAFVGVGLAGCSDEYDDFYGMQDVPSVQQTYAGAWMWSASDTIPGQQRVDKDFDGKDGVDGKDGASPELWTIGNDGFWYLNGEKTGYKATGSNAKEEAGDMDALHGMDSWDGYNGGIDIKFSPVDGLIFMSPMPVNLFLAMMRDNTLKPTTMPDYHVLCIQKGYSSTTIIYDLVSPSTYSFNTLDKEGKAHEVEVLFGGISEMVVDVYLRTLTLKMYVGAISVDGELRAANTGSLTLRAELQD